MTCNIVKNQRMVMREAKELAGECTDPPAVERPRGMSNQLYQALVARRTKEWTERLDEIIGNDNWYFICGDLKVVTCPCGHVSSHLCDYPMGDGATCDAPLCDKCRKNIGPDLDCCLIHHAQFVGAKHINRWPPDGAR